MKSRNLQVSMSQNFFFFVANMFVPGNPLQTVFICEGEARPGPVSQNLLRP